MLSEQSQTSTSLISTRPCSGLSSPTSDFRNTDFPVPEGPSSTLISPFGRVSVTSRQMVCAPKDFDKPSTLTSTPIRHLRVPPLAALLVAPLRRAHRAHLIGELRTCDPANERQ